MTRTSPTARGAQTDQQLKREELYRRNNLGVALMEQYKHEDAVKKFKEALAQDANFTIGRINLALAYYFLNDGKNATTEAQAALKSAPRSPQALYILGASYKKDRLYPEALAAFNQLLAIDPKDPYTNIQIGQIYSATQQYAQAAEAFRQALDAESYNSTAAYSLAQALIRSGKTAEGQQMLAQFQKLKASGYATTLGLTYGEQGKYAEAVVTTGVEPDLVSLAGAPVSYRLADAGVSVKSYSPALDSVLGRKLARGQFTEEFKRELISPFSTNQTMGDLDGDRKPDLVVNGVDQAGKPFLRLFRNEGGKFNEVTGKSGLTANQYISGVVLGDFDNDEKTDLAVFGYRTLAVWRNQGDGAFVNVTEKLGLPANYNAWAMSAAWVDADHDGDLDLIVGNFARLDEFPAGETAIFPDDFAGEENRLFRNNGNGSFTDTTAPSGLGGGRQKTTAIVCTDYNNQRDIDFLFVNYGGPVQLFSNQRDGSFREVAARAGLKSAGKSFGAGAGDLNKDNFVDFYFPSMEGGDQLFLSDGRGAFTAAPVKDPVKGISAQVADYDNDGLLDVVTLTAEGLLAQRGLGDRLAAPVNLNSQLKLRSARSFAMGDIDGDGGGDLIALTQGDSHAVLKAEGFGKNFSRLLLAGKTSNRSAVGTKVEMRSGSLRQKLEIYASSPAPAPAGLVFGLGYRTTVDAVQLFWPAGILQSELAVTASTSEQPANPIDELDRKGTSCPLLYAWNGNEYSFVTDFLGGSAFGYLLAPGKYNYPDTDEYIRITDEQLKEKDGLLSLRLNNQLEEVIFFDAVQLLAIDHPANLDVYPNERLMPGPPYPEFKLYAVKSPKPPLAARDDKGNDILPLLTEVDRRYPEEFEKLRFKGYAREHAIELDLGDLSKARRVTLLMTAWIDYADSTSNLAASQAGEKLIPPYLQVRNERGEWQTVIPQMGFPAGLPKTMTVDLSGKFLCGDSRVRIVTSMRIYWDQILVDTFDGSAPIKTRTLSPRLADLRWRGFPREYSPDGRKPLIYDYRVIDSTAPWKAHLGNYTRFGDVRELLLSPDDRYVVTRNGDEVQVDFDARQLPTLPSGWKRTYLLYADGFGKDMDINSARPETIGELPYHGMKSYPYSATDRYPASPRHREYLRRYNTRTVNEQLRASWQGVK